jgi:hypothetical protein
MKKVLNLLCETIFQTSLHVFFIFLPSSLPAKSHILRSVRWPPNETRALTHARDRWWTLDFANAFLSPGVNSRAELVPSPRAYARKGAPRRWLWDDHRTHAAKLNNLNNIFWSREQRRIAANGIRWKYHVLKIFIENIIGRT